MPSRTFLANSRPISVRGRTSIVRIIPEIYDSKSRNPSNLKYSGCVSNRIFKDSVRIYSAEIRNSTHTSLMGRKQMTDLEKGQILGMARSHSPREIAKAIGRDYRTIHRLLKKFQTTGSTDRVQGSGRKRKTSPRKDRLIKRIALSDRRLSSSEIRKKLDLDVSTKTIRNRLHEFGIKSYWSIKKPFISETNRTKRLAWAKEHLNWSATAGEVFCGPMSLLFYSVTKAGSECGGHTTNATSPKRRLQPLNMTKRLTFGGAFHLQVLEISI